MGFLSKTRLWLYWISYKGIEVQGSEVEKFPPLSGFKR